MYGVADSSPLPSKIAHLIDRGPVIEEIHRFDNDTKYIELAPLGYGVAERPQDVEDLMNGLEPEADRTDHGAPEAEGDHARP